MELIDLDFLSLTIANFEFDLEIDDLYYRCLYMHGKLSVGAEKI